MRKTSNLNLNQGNRKFYKKGWFKITMIILILILIGGGVFAYKTGSILNKISDSDTSSIKSLLNLVRSGNEIKMDENGRINLALFGMRGENIPGGGLLADTIIIISLKPDESKAAIISVPRDLYVTMPGTSQKMKINAVHYNGEQKGDGQGLKAMEEILSEVTGLDIQYSASLNFVGYKQLIDAVDGIDVYLESPFYETSQFHEMKVCNGDIGGSFTVETGEFEHKKNENGKIVASYPLCYNTQEECGGEFTLPAGNNHLDGETALCYARARENTSDFDRSKRQQLMLMALKDKLISMGTLSDFGKINGILNAVGDNVRTDLGSSEMKKFFEKYSSMKEAELYRRVLENSVEGYLMVPQDAPEGAGYILIPRAGWDNYSEIHQMSEEIFVLSPQSDINPVKQYTRPASKKVDSDKKDEKKKDKDEE